MKKLIALLIMVTPVCLFSQNDLLQNPTTGALPITGIINDIELVSNGTDVVLVAAHQDGSEFFAIDIADNSPDDAAANNLTFITDFQNKVDGITGQSGLEIKNFEVNPISKAVYILAANSGNTESYIIKLEHNGSTMTLLDFSQMTYSLIDWNGVNAFDDQDMSWGNNTLYITSGNWSLDGEIATVQAPFAHNSTTTNRATSMFKTNWGGFYYTTAPLERFDFATVNGEDRLLGVTVCAPGFSLPIDSINGSGILAVQEVFNVNLDPPLKVVHQEQSGTNYLFNLHRSGAAPYPLMRIGESYLDGSPITNNEFNNNAPLLRDFAGNPTGGLTDEAFKIYTEKYDMIAKWDEWTLLVLAQDTMTLYATGIDPFASTPTVAPDQEVVIFPNPAEKHINIRLKEGYQAAALTIYSIDGRAVLSETMEAGQDKVDIGSLKSGSYILTVTAGETVIYRDKLLVN